MNAITFIKDHGVERAREVVEGQKDTVAPNLFKYFSPSLNDYHMLNIENNVRISELKRLVLRLDLIDRLGGINKASELFIKYQHSGEACFQEYLQCSSRNLKQAIADYEAIHEIEN